MREKQTYERGSRSGWFRGVRVQPVLHYLVDGHPGLGSACLISEYGRCRRLLTNIREGKRDGQGANRDGAVSRLSTQVLTEQIGGGCDKELRR